ncbi:MAG: hypothetical protein ACO1N3_04915 [Gammaproteobacteria bacterium]
MQAPIQPDFNKDDLNSYNDEKIAAFLLELQEKSLEDLLIAQTKIAEEYAKATKEYEAEKTSIRWARRRYWMLIFVGVFREIWRVLVKGKETNYSKLKKRKADLKAEYSEQDEAYNTQLTLVYESIETIKMYSNEVTQRTKELHDLNAVIERLDATYYQFGTDSPEDRSELENRLAKHIEDREILNGYINQLCKKTEDLITGLAGLLDNFQPDPLPKEFLSQYREANAEKIAALRERCKEVDHPVIPKLLTFLARRTAGSLQDLQTEIANNKNLFEDRLVGDIVWDANTLYPAIFLGKNREQALFDYVTSQETELAALQKIIEATDEKLQVEDNAEIRKSLNQFLQQRDQLSSAISHLLLLHRDILSGNHASLLEKVHFLARQHSENTLVNDLKRQCDKIQHPITKALSYFLTYRTDASLRALKSTMEDDLSYLESRDFVRIIEKAGEIDNRITSGWVKEEELPSIKEIQQGYINEVSERLAKLETELDTLTDFRVDFSNEIHRLETELKEIAKRYTRITDHDPRGYLPRNELDQIKRDPSRYAEFLEVKEEYKTHFAILKETKASLAEVNKVIQEKEIEKQQCIIEPVTFTPEILQALIKKCEQVKRLGRVHPVAAALGVFLNYPTPSLLTKLKLAMQEYPDYQKNENIVKLLNEANHYFPYIQREPHIAQQRAFEFFQSIHRESPKSVEDYEESSNKKRRFGPSSSTDAD